MAQEVVMPRLSDTMDSGTVAKWLKAEGDAVKRGDILAEIETDKSNMELEAFSSGVLVQILVPEGKSAALGAPIALMAANEREAEEMKSTATQPTSTAPTESNGATSRETTPPPASTQAGTDSPPGERIKVSPLARRLAEEHNLDLATINGTGPGGRITKEDVLGAVREVASPPSAAEPAVTVPAAPPPTPLPNGQGVRAAQPAEMTRMQRTIARRMTEAKFSAPEFLLTAEYDMTQARALLSSIAGVEGAPKVGPNDLVIKACAAALRRHPEVNSGWENDGIMRYGRINVGNAVAVEGGLVVPVIHDADSKSLAGIAAESKALIAKARAGKLAPEEYGGGTFTVSNLGMFGIDQFTAIINPPEACILAVGAITSQPVVEEGGVVIRDRLRVTLSCDHRVINGAQGAEFLLTLRRLLENPMLALL